MRAFLPGQAFILASVLFSAAVFAQDADGDFFSDDDLFGDDNIVELEETNAGFGSEKNGAAHGAIFENGSIKIGGSYDMGFTTYVSFYDGSLTEQKSFIENLSEARIAPKANAWLSVDARPKQTFRLYTKFGIDYPYAITATSYPVYGTQAVSAALGSTPLNFDLPVVENIITAITSSFCVKELFTDFSIADRAFFRFGLHTVTWGTGLFYSPVSDIINTSSIDPEDTDEQVNGSLNLRTQITFPGTQNCLWLYMIPDTRTATSTYSYAEQLQFPYEAKRTGFAAKGELVLGGWELGAGAFWKWQSSPKAMLTASGSVLSGRINLFGEGVWRYGSDTEWSDKPDGWEEKTNVFQATAGARYYDKTNLILYAVQYYFDGNDADDEYSTKGHNIAMTVNFGRIGNTSFTGNIFGMFNFGKTDLPQEASDILALYSSGKKLNPYTAVVSGAFTYSPINELSLSLGPYITWSTWEKGPAVAMKFSVSLGSGKF